MLHVLIALYVLGALAGVAAAMYAGRYRLVFGFPFFRPLVRYLLFSALLMLVLLSTYYAAANITNDGTGSDPLRILWVVSNTLTGFVAFSGLLVSFLQVLKGFEGKPLAAGARAFLAVLIVGVFCSYAFGFGRAVLGGPDSWLRWSRATSTTWRFQSCSWPRLSNSSGGWGEPPSSSRGGA